jgi:predicted nucleic acid-binding protein
MNVLVDTSIWSLALRRKPADLSRDESDVVALLTAIIKEGRARIIGPIRQELLSGVKTESQFDALRKALEPFADEPLLSDDYEDAARVYNACRSQGLQAGPIDILICSMAGKRGWQVFSLDANLNRCARALKVASVENSGARKE